MRPTKDAWLLELAGVVAKRGTCVRRQVGCVLADAAGHVLATGYNGVASGVPHCSEGHPCGGADLPSGQGLDLCEAVHAEQNALLQCHDVGLIRTCYVTVSPCVTCTKLLLNTACQRIVYAERYAHDDAACELWTRLQSYNQRREWLRLTAEGYSR
jgi:dCMP deaminase